MSSLFMIMSVLKGKTNWRRTASPILKNWTFYCSFCFSTETFLWGSFMFNLPMLASLRWWYSKENAKVKVYTLSSFPYMPLIFLPQSSQDFFRVFITKIFSVYSYRSMKVVREENELKILATFGIMLGEADKYEEMSHEKSFLLIQVCRLTGSLQSLPWIQGVWNKSRNLVSSYRLSQWATSRVCS